MQQTQLLFLGLKKILKRQGPTYKQLSQSLGLSEASVKRIFSDANCTMERFEEICQLANSSILDVIREVGLATAEEHLTLAQEEQLVSDPLNFIVFYLLLRDWKASDIQSRNRLSDSRMTKILVGLDRIGLIELQTQTRVKLKVKRTVTWIPDGPVYQMFEKHVKAEFLSNSFSEKNAFFHFQTGELSESSIRYIKKKLESLNNDIGGLIASDSTLPKDETLSIGLVVGLRPWVFSIFR